ncbi:MAG: S9 family peptidase [Armatimonadaceae bacterium]
MSDTTTAYRLPPQPVVDAIDAPPTPATSLSPNRSTLLLVEYTAYPSISLLARPFLKLGGIRVDPERQTTYRTTEYRGIRLMSVATGETQTVTGLPEDAVIGFPSWSLDSKRFAFTRDIEGGMELWVGDLESASCRQLPGLLLTDILAGPLIWMDDSRRLLTVAIPANRPPSPETPRVPEGPVVMETAGKQTRAATYQDLLASPHDELLFEHFGTTQLMIVDTETGSITPLGEPGMFYSLRLSPDEKYLLTIRLHHPFSYRVPSGYFARSVEVIEVATGTVIYTVADLPVSDEVPQQGVPTGPRSVVWQEKKPATLLWTEALDNGDPLAKVPHRDRLMTLSAPFTEEPTELLRLKERHAGWDWTDRENQVFLHEYDRERRWRTTYVLNTAKPEETRRVLFDLSINDVYNDPGSPVYQPKPEGHRTMVQDGDTIYLSGRGATPEGDRPFLDAYNLVSSEKTRLFLCRPECFEFFIAFLDDSRKSLLISYQSPTEPPNYFVVNTETGERRALTQFPDPHPHLTGLKKELVKYQRSDGVPLSGTLYLPPDYDPASGKRLPLVVWAYPLEYSDADTAGQVRGSTTTFTRLAGTSPLWFVTQGYAVLHDATMPVVGDPETMNDTFVEQVVDAAKSAIVEMEKRGIADPNRVLVSGHSYGGFMTATLLAHAPGLFAAGIARSGAYNRTLTPFGFQSERRSFWEVPEIYVQLSPFTHAHRIKEPLLLIHGQSDNNPGTYTIQSERFFQALQGTGATARLVLLPYESHGYRARESVLHVLAEMFDWADTYVKNRPHPDSDSGNADGIELP